MSDQFTPLQKKVPARKSSAPETGGGKMMAPPAAQLQASPLVASQAPVDTKATGAMIQQQLLDRGTLEFQQFQILNRELGELQAFPADGPESLKGMAEVGAAAKIIEIEACKKRMEALQKDLQVLGNSSTPPETINEIIARNYKTTVTGVSTYTEDGRAMLSRDGVSKESKELKSQAVNGIVINETSARKDTYGFLNWKGTDTNAREVKVDDKKVVASTADSKSVDLLAGSISSSKKDELKVGDKVSSQEVSKTLNLGGYNQAVTTVEGTEKDKTTEVKSKGAFRGDGIVGVKAGSSKTVEKDGAKAEVKKDANVGIVTGDEGVGLIGGLSASEDKLAKDGLKTGTKVSAKGKFVTNVEEIPGTDPKEYAITVTIGGDISLGASVGREQMPADESNMKGGNFEKASMGVGASYEGSRGMTFRKRLSAKEAKAYLDSVTAAENGKPVSHHKELGIIAAVVNNGGNVQSAVESQARIAGGNTDWVVGLDNGDSVSTFGSDKVGVDINASMEDGGVGLGFKLGESSKEGWAHTVGKEGGQLAITVALDEENASSRGLTAGVGIVSGEFGLGRKETNARSVKVLIPVDHPKRKEILSKLTSAKTRAAVDEILMQYHLAPAVQIDSVGYADTETAGIKIAPFGINYGAGGAMKESVATDAEGKEVRSFEASNDLGGSLSVGDYKYESGAREALSATIDAEGQVSGDISRTTSETDLGKSGSKFLENLKHNTLGVITGSAKSAEKEVNVAGMILSNEDFERIIATAENPKAWTKLNNSTMLWDDWQATRHAILAAKGDKAKATRALAAFVGKSGHGREAILEHAVRDFGSDQGGARYEFPEGTGDLKGKYLSLAVADPVEAIRLNFADGKMEEGMKKASSTLLQLNDLKFTLNTYQDKFNPGILGEMIAQISARQIEVKKMIARFNAKKEGKELDETQVEDVTAKDRYTQLIEDCKTYKRQEMLAFQRIEATYEDEHVSSGEAIDNMAETVKLNELYVKWDKAMAELQSLDTSYGMSSSSKEWKQYRPSKQRFNNAVGGKNPFEYTVEKETEDLQREAQADKFNEEIMHNSTASVMARAEYEAKQATAARKVERSEATKIWDPQIKSIRDQAYKGGGMCNGMNASGKAAEIKPEASKFWGQAFTKLALGAKSHEQYKYIANHPDAVKLAVDNAAGKVIALFQEAIKLFGQGNAAQKA